MADRLQNTTSTGEYAAALHQQMVVILCGAMLTPSCVCRAVLWRGVVQVLGEDLKLVLGQQDRMERGSDTWANPVSYDKLGE